MRRSLLQVVVLGGLVAAGGAGLHAQGSPGALSADQIVAIRKSLMDLQQGVAGAMKGAVEAKADVKPLVPGAKGLLQSSKVIVSLFPVGTEKAGETKAKPEVWSDPAGFAKAASALTEASQKLVTLAEADDKEGFAAQFAAVGKTCGACHRTYKEKDN